MAHIRVAVLEKTGPGSNRIMDPVGAEHCTDRLIARTEALRHTEDIRRDAVDLAGEQCALFFPSRT